MSIAHIRVLCVYNLCLYLSMLFVPVCFLTCLAYWIVLSAGLASLTIQQPQLAATIELQPAHNHLHCCCGWI